nr:MULTISPECIES: HEAT repeat domain-containing protein [unclassified Bradyrhizobium]
MTDSHHSPKDWILQLQHSNDPLGREWAAKELAAFKDDESFRALVAALDDEHLSVCEAASAALATRGEPGAVPALISALGRTIAQHKNSSLGTSFWLSHDLQIRLLCQLSSMLLSRQTISIGDKWLKRSASSARLLFWRLSTCAHDNAEARAGATSALAEYTAILSTVGCVAHFQKSAGLDGCRKRLAIYDSAGSARTTH